MRSSYLINFLREQRELMKHELKCHNAPLWSASAEIIVFKSCDFRMTFDWKINKQVDLGLAIFGLRWGRGWLLSGLISASTFLTLLSRFATFGILPGMTSLVNENSHLLFDF